MRYKPTLIPGMRMGTALRLSAAPVNAASPAYRVLPFGDPAFGQTYITDIKQAAHAMLLAGAGLLQVAPKRAPRR